MKQAELHAVPGDTVYVIDHFYEDVGTTHIETVTLGKIYFHGKVLAGVEHIYITPDGAYAADRFGVDIFTTRTEAEKVLEQKYPKRRLLK